MSHFLKALGFWLQAMQGDRNAALFLWDALQPFEYSHQAAPPWYAVASLAQRGLPIAGHLRAFGIIPR